VVFVCSKESPFIPRRLVDELELERFWNFSYFCIGQSDGELKGERLLEEDVSICNMFDFISIIRNVRAQFFIDNLRFLGIAKISKSFIMNTKYSLFMKLEDIFLI